MNGKLNLLPPRIIASAADLDAFKRDAASAVLRFAAGNPCDLEVVTDTLNAKYTEISTALTEGCKVETGLDVMPPGCPGCIEASAGPRVYDEENRELSKDPEEEASNLIYADPADIVEQQQEREISEAAITPEDLAKLLANSPEKQKVGASILQHAAALGEATAYSLLSLLAHNKLSAKELKAVTSNLRILSADDDNPRADTDSEAMDLEDEGLNASEEMKPQSEDPAEGSDSDEKAFAEILGAETKEISEIIKQVNQQLDIVDNTRSIARLSLADIVSGREVSTRKERETFPDPETPPETEADVEGAFPSWMEYVMSLVAPAITSQGPLKLKEFFKAQKQHRDPTALVTKWYEDSGIDPKADTLKGIKEILEREGVTDITAEKVLGAVKYLAKSPAYPLHADLVYKAMDEARLEHPSDREFVEGLKEEHYESEARQKENTNTDHKDFLSQYKKDNPEDQEFQDWYGLNMAPGKPAEVTPKDKFRRVHLQPVTEAPESWSNEQKAKYKFQVTDSSGKNLGYYPTESDAEMDYPELKKLEI